MPDSDKNTAGQEGVLTIEQHELRRPSMFKVLLHNDDFTPMEFVTTVLESVFRKSSEDAVHIMLCVHQKGVGVAGIYTFEVAETKVAAVTDLARANEHPLRCSMEAE